MIAQIQVRRGTSAEWAAADPVLASGEWGLDETTGVVKIGDGESTWSQLEVQTGGPAGQVAYVENRSGVVTYSTGPGAIIEGMIIAVPPSERDLEVRWGISTAMALGGEGAVHSLLIETTGGGAAIRGICAKKYESNNTASAQGFTHEGIAELGPSTVWRTFMLQLGHYSATASAIVGYALNSNTDYGKTFLMGEYI